MRLAQLIVGGRSNAKSAKALLQLSFAFNELCIRSKASPHAFYLGIFTRKFSGSKMNLGGNGTVWPLPRGG